MDSAQVTNERGKVYGSFEDHSRISQRLSEIVMEGEAEFNDIQAEALSMICHKIGRILSGNPLYADSWRDIGGYARLVADTLPIIDCAPSLPPETEVGRKLRRYSESERGEMPEYLCLMLSEICETVGYISSSNCYEKTCWEDLVDAAEMAVAFILEHPDGLDAKVEIVRVSH